MASTTANELRKKCDAAFSNISRQLQGMEPHLDRAEAPGEWTARQVLSHLLFAPGADLVATLQTFRERDLAVMNLEPGQVHLTPERQAMSLKQLVEALDAQRQAIFGYLDTLADADLEHRKMRIPLFKQFMGTEEIPIATFIGGMFDYHWNDHAGQLAKIRKAAGLPPA
jgi:hypothetical protein